MNKYIIQACNDLVRIISPSGGPKYGHPNLLSDKDYWIRPSIKIIKPPNTHAAYMENSGLPVNPNSVADQMCDRDISSIGPDGTKLLKGIHYDCYAPYYLGVIVKNSSSPSAALRRIFSMPKLYAFECFTACVIVFYKAILNMVNDTAFDQLFPNLTISTNFTAMPLYRYLDISNSEEKAPPGFESKLEIGGWYYITNWDVSKAGEDLGKTGENVIYLGEDTFFGFPFGKKKKDDIIGVMNNLRNPGSKTSASFNKSYKKLLHGKIMQDVPRFGT